MIDGLGHRVRARLLGKTRQHWGAVFAGVELEAMAVAVVTFFWRTMVMGAVAGIAVVAGVLLQELTPMTGPWSLLLVWGSLAIPVVRVFTGYRAVKVTAATAAGLPRSEARRLNVSDPRAFERSLREVARSRDEKHEPTPSG